MTARDERLVWVDLEMSGLDVSRCAILEIAVLVTDAGLEEAGEGLELVVHQPDEVLEAMDEWCTEHHGASGLTAAVRSSHVSIEEAESRALELVSRYCDPGQSPLCGNSVHLDRAFLAAYMPRLHAFLHYRNIDVSTLKELVRRWYPSVPIPQKAEAHRALGDLRESIAELRYYRERVFR